VNTVHYPQDFSEQSRRYSRTPLLWGSMASWVWSWFIPGIFLCAQRRNRAIPCFTQIGSRLSRGGGGYSFAPCLRRSSTILVRPLCLT